tara:strand:+ start:83401 stop:83928 length:528 start_codon:yes stop_codon:yes gene_type:complete
MVTDLYSKLFEQRIIFLITDITGESANLIKSQLLYLDQLSNDPIKLYIDSNGGEVYTCMGLIDTMKYIKSPVETVNIGICASMGAIILCCGDSRKSLPNSRVMIHQPTGGRFGQVDDILITSKELLRIRKVLYKILSEKTGKTVKEIEKDSERDMWMDAKESLKYGLIDKIIETK